MSLSEVIAEISICEQQRMVAVRESSCPAEDGYQAKSVRADDILKVTNYFLMARTSLQFNLLAPLYERCSSDVDGL